MDERCFETKRGKILRVGMCEGGYRTWEYPEGAPLEGHYKEIQALPTRATFEEAQYDLDAYALRMEYNPAMPPQENTPESPEAPNEGGQEADEAGSTPGEEQGSVPEGGASPPPDSSEATRPTDEEETKRLHHLQDLLEICCGRLISTKMDKASQVSHFNGRIKGIEEEMDNLLQQIQTTRYGIEHPSAQKALPFDAPAQPEEVSPETAPESTEEAPATGEPSLEEDAPQAEVPGIEAPEESSTLLPFNESAPCLACGHAWGSAHFGAAGAPRTCAVIGCDCMASLFEAKPQAVQATPREATP